ncbi:MAG TPA: transcriptional regulator, partial [Candidatus Marinimicrobia bacterium]|nr:transcriptional regulator [Candidatus Neomarinimicrobiota bacterium]
PSHFVNQVFGGSASRLAAFLLPNINLQPEDILVIRQMLKEAEDQNG